MIGERRPTGQMPYRRRQDGNTALDRREIASLCTSVAMLLASLTILMNIPNQPLFRIFGTYFSRNGFSNGNYGQN
jgi:hypothetical protein